MYDYGIFIIKLLQVIAKKVKKRELKLNKKEIEKYGLLVVFSKEVIGILNINTRVSRMSHEIDALIHLLFVVSLCIEKTDITRELVLAIIYMRFFILATHQANVMFFDRYINGTEKCNISSFPRIVMISIINAIEIYYSYQVIGEMNVAVMIVGLTTGMQLLASVVQLYNFKDR